MVESTEESKKENSIDLRNNENLLVLSIDKNGKIVQFNRECEKIVGYNRDEVLNREFFDLLIPKSYIEQWEKMFDSVKRNERINDFKLPWLTHHGQEIMISWSSFPIEHSGEAVGDICLVGRLVSPEDNIKKSSIELTEKEMKNKVDVDQVDDKEKNRLLFKFRGKNIVFSSDYPVNSRDGFDDVGVVASSKKEKNLEIIKNRLKESIETEETNENYVDLANSNKGIDKTIKKLNKRNKELEKENKKLERDLNNLKIRLVDGKEEKMDETCQSIRKKTTNLFNRYLYFLFILVGGKRKKDEFERMSRELDERKNLLNSLEAQLVNDKKNLNEQKNMFCRWREKLVELEEEVVKRRNELIDQEKMFENNLVSSLDESAREMAMSSGDEVSSVGESDGETVEYHDIFGKISDCAAVVQRGILKQVNRSFVEMLGYDMEEVIGKSLFDFVVVEGLSGIERYYLNRLKGDGSSSFETVFSTKDDNKVVVEVSTRPTIFNGEKAEIAVFKKLDDQKLKELILEKK